MLSKLFPHSEFIAKLYRKYRINLVDNETLFQRKQIVMKPINMILLGFFLFAIITGATASLIIFTPLKTLIPGYVINPELQQNFETVQKRVFELEMVVSHQDSFIRSLQAAYDIEGGGTVAALPADYQYDLSELNIPQEIEEGHTDHETESQGLSVPVPLGMNVNHTHPVNLISPLNGIITNEFNLEDKHFGIDLVANENSIIRSVSDGFVIFSEYSNQTGYVIGISHGNGLVSFYKHNSRVYKKVGSYVFAGEAIAVIGNSGENSTGPHLHFELWDNGKPVNPRDYIVFN